MATTPVLSVTELAARLAAGTIHVLDVREDDEWHQSHIAHPAIIHLPLSRLEQHLEALPSGPLAVLCRVGGRSARVAAFLCALGHSASNVAGGLVAWVQEVDPTLPPP